MKFSTLSIALLLTLSMNSNQLAAKTIYQWVDKSGKRHFSDKAPSSDIAIKFHGNSLTSIDIVRLKPIKLSKPRAAKKKSVKGNNNRTSSKLGRCTKIKAKIETLENKLKLNLVAEKSDQYSRELTSLKWRKIKSC